MIRPRACELLRISVQSLASEVVEPTPDGIDVDERQIVIVRAVCQQNEGRLPDRVYPQTRACKS